MMRRNTLGPLKVSAFALILLVATPVLADLPAGSPAESRPVTAGLLDLPLRFEPNVGQTDGRFQYLSRGPGYALFLTREGAVLSLGTPAPARGTVDPIPSRKASVLGIHLYGADKSVAFSGRDLLKGRSNYFLGNDPSRWRTDVPNFARVVAENVYPDIDLAYYGNGRQLEFDFIVKPGADPERIVLDLRGASGLRLNHDGALEITVEGGQVLLQKPLIYQETAGGRRTVDGRFVLKGKNHVAFEVCSYDKARTLIVDPVLGYATYLGGTLDDMGYSIAVDDFGQAYVTGQTSSTNFPTKSPFQAANAGNSDVFVSKLKADGSDLLYSTYLGGTSGEAGLDIAVSDSGEAMVCGVTASSNFPTYHPIQAASGGNDDCFVAALNANGSALLYSTYLGGSNDDYAWGIAVDSTGAAYISGFSTSTNFPTSNPYQSTKKGAEDVILAKLTPLGTSLVYSTYIGGTLDEVAYRVVTDQYGNAYVAGVTQSSNFPTKVPLQAANAGGTDAFVLKMNAAGSDLVYSTYLGGSANDGAIGIAVDSLGQAHVAGYTLSTNFRTASPYQPANNGGQDAFVAKLKDDGSALLFSTYLGGNDTDQAWGIALGKSGEIYVTGQTRSTTLFPILQPLQANLKGNYDSFLTQMNRSGSALVFSTYLGGSLEDIALQVGVDPFNNIYLGGATRSTDFPATSNSVQMTNKGLYDAFVAKVSPAFSCKAAASPNSGTAPLLVNFTGSVEGGTPPYTYAWNFDDGGTGSGQTASHTYNAAATYHVVLTATDSKAQTATDTVTVTVAPPAPLTATASGNPTSGVIPFDVAFTSSATGGIPPYTYAWAFGDGATGTGATVNHTYSTAGTFSAVVTVTDSVSATAQATVTITASPPAPLAVIANGNPTSGNIPLSVAFGAVATGGYPPYTYAWVFGDGGVGAGATVTHVYATAGTYPAQVTVVDQESGTAQATVTIHAINPPVITGVTKASDPFRLKIAGTNFHPNCTVKINGAVAPTTQYVSSSSVKAKGGSTLKAMCPKGVAVQVTVTNNDDGGVSAAFPFTR